jgi:hypothetical protein
MKNTCVLTVFVEMAALSFAQNGSPSKQDSAQNKSVVVRKSTGNFLHVSVRCISDGAVFNFPVKHFQ